MTLLAPMSAHSLGVGTIKLHSALNQKLNAEIMLSLSAGEELADIKVSLASPDKFDQAGIAWNSFLAKIKLEPILKANGQVVVKVTSHEVVQEPFLDFLVEVSWPKGEIFKEFTVLVDPPAVYLQSAIETPTITAVKPTVNRVNATDSAVQSLAIEGEYGPTNRSDSLWRVAEKVNKYSDVSVEQMMMALYKANPRAFYKKNVNALMAGKSLKIPKKSEIVQLSKKQANTEFYNQMAVWEGKAIAEPETQLVSTDNTKTSNQLTLVPPTEGLVDTDALSADASDVDVRGLKTENQQLQERLANLEKQFVIMQEMLAIKDQQLATIQNAKIAPESQVKEEQEQKQEQKQEQEQEDTEVTAPPLVEEGSLTKSPVATPTVTPEQKTVKQVPKQAPLPVVNKPVAPPVVEQESSGFNYSYLGFGLGGLALAGIALLFWRRRQVEEEINDNSMFASSSEIVLPEVDDELSVPVFDETPSYDVGTVGESSFLSEFSPSDFDVFESDQAEVDPTSEADVYLAYGRYQQAEELMRQAIKDFPDKDDYKLKLLEIFYASENSEAFAAFSEELVAEGKNSDLAFWGKVSEMGSELVPGSDLFSTEQRESKFEAVDKDDDFATVNESSAISEQESPAVVTKEQADVSLSKEDEDTSDNSEIDFDLSSFSLMDDNEDTGKLAAKAEEEIESVDFDLNSFDTVDSDAKKTPEPNTPEDLETFDFDQADILSSQEPLVLDDDMDDVNLGDFDFSSDSSPLGDADDKAEKSVDTAAELESVNVESDKLESNDFDFDFDFDDTSVAEKSEVPDEDSLMVSDLTDMDEFETKIDLAKAYIDMGDTDAAKDIAQEVLEKGTDAQKQEAQAIIDKLV